MMVIMLLPVLASTAAPSAAFAPTAERRPNEAFRPADVRLVGYSFTSAAGAAVPIDAYLPRVASGLRPAVVYVHGGGWREGTRRSFSAGESFVPTGRRLVREGFVVLSVGYRLAPGRPFPAGADDVSAAVRWVRANASRLGVDPDRIGLFGSSAGGTLAAFAATRARGARNRGSRVRAVVSWSGPMALRRLHHALAGDSRRTTMVSDYLGCHPDSCQITAADASPINYVDPTDPPMMLVNSLQEFIPPEQATRMSDELRRHGVPHTLMLLPGGAHAGQFERRAWQSTLRFLHRHLGWPAAG